MIQQLIARVNDPSVRESLLGQPADDLTCDFACNIAHAKVNIRQQNQLFKAETFTPETARLQPVKKPQSKEHFASMCFRCGSEQHIANNPSCPAQNIMYRNCGCRTFSHLEQSSDTKSETSAVDQTIYAISQTQMLNVDLSVEPKLSSPDIRTVCSKVVQLNMELDSASPITVVPYSFYMRHFSFLPVNPSSYVFNRYSNHSVHILGFIVVTLFLKETLQCTVGVHVSSMESKPLLGRNAMIPLHAASIIDRMTISSIDADSLRVNYSNLFLPNIGKIPRAMHQINLKPNTVACSISQTRLVPLAKRHAVSEVLNRNG